MFRKGFLIVVFSLLIIVASFFTGYFTMQRYAKQSSDKNPVNSSGINFNPTASAETSNQQLDALINDKTKIVKQSVYTNGVSYKPGYETVEVVEIPEKDVIGLNLEQASRYFKDKGYIVSKFTADEVVLKEEIKDSWTPNRFIIKDENGTVKIYSTDKDGKLAFVENYEMDLGVQSDDIKQEINKGIIFMNKDEAYGYLDDINS